MAPSLTADVFASPAGAILCELEHDGFRVELTADNVLSIAPRSRLTSDRMTAIAGCKDALKLLVRCCDASVVERRDVFRRQREDMPAPRVPAFLFNPGIVYAPGACFSCGDALPALTFSMCWRCSLARRLACNAPVPVDLFTAYDEARICA